MILEWIFLLISCVQGVDKCEAAKLQIDIQHDRAFEQLTGG
jgi:hypothetical protein